jgi:multidrug efflux pump
MPAVERLRRHAALGGDHRVTSVRRANVVPVRAMRSFFMQARWIVIGVMLVSAAALRWCTPACDQSCRRIEDRGVISSNITAPDGATLDYTNRYARELERVGQGYKEFDRIFANVGNPSVSQGNVTYRTVDWDERKRSTIELARELQPEDGRAAGGVGLSDHAALAGPGLS